MRPLAIGRDPSTSPSPASFALLFAALTMTGLALPGTAKPVPMSACASCHPAAYGEFLRHGMSRSLGTVDAPPSGAVKNKKTGWQYEIKAERGTTILESTAPDGGLRRQAIVGRIGAGIFDRSWAAVELDASGAPTDRLFFAPVETITGHGLELSPFEYSERPSGPNMPMGQGCLVCHTDTRASELPGAALARSDGPVASGPVTSIHPGHSLGAKAFDYLEPLDCSACHGDVSRHLALMNEEQKARPGEDDLGLPRLATLDAGVQRDVCARCHLQGDARFELISARPGFERPTLDRPLTAQVPAMVADLPPEKAGDDFRFVGQLERLASSACFVASPEMTCTTCHSAHRSVAEQGLASFERACQACHGGAQDHASSSKASADTCSRSPELSVATVTGEAMRGEVGCVDCHMRRSQPYDLPGIRSIDHRIRRRLPKPQDDVPFRSVQDPKADLVPYDDGRLTKVLSTQAGRRWSQGLAAMAYMQVGRFEEAIAGFSLFPAPGSKAARQGSAPAPLESLEIQTSFHEQRALAYMAQGRPDQAILAFCDALALDPSSPGALLGRARLAVGTGDSRTALLDTQRMIELWPASEAPWEVRLRLAERLGRPDLALEALVSMTTRWPSDPGAWMKLGLLQRQRGDQASATRSFEQVRRLSPITLDRGLTDASR